MAEQILVVDILKNGQLTHKDYELDYGKEPGQRIEIVKLIRDALGDPYLHIQMYQSEMRPCKEVNWPRQPLILSNMMEKAGLDRMRESHIIINTTYRTGSYFDRPFTSEAKCLI